MRLAIINCRQVQHEPAQYMQDAGEMYRQPRFHLMLCSPSVCRVVRCAASQVCIYLHIRRGCCACSSSRIKASPGDDSLIMHVAGITLYYSALLLLPLADVVVFGFAPSPTPPRDTFLQWSWISFAS